MELGVFNGESSKRHENIDINWYTTKAVFLPLPHVDPETVVNAGQSAYLGGAAFGEKHTFM
jgi:hypothetical protein